MAIQSLQEQIYNHVIWEIRLGKLSSGDKVSDSELADSLHISRTPVREALTRLSNDNILRNNKNKGFFVREFSIDELKKKAAIIARLDAYAAELAMPYITEAHLTEMEDYIHRLDLAIKQKDYRFYYECQEHFHNVYFRLVPNEYLIETINTLQKNQLRTLPLSDDEEYLFHHLSIFNEDHKTMVECFRNKDLQKLTEVVFKHRYNPSSDTDNRFY